MTQCPRSIVTEKLNLARGSNQRPLDSKSFVLSVELEMHLTFKIQKRVEQFILTHSSILAVDFFFICFRHRERQYLAVTAQLL